MNYSLNDTQCNDAQHNVIGVRACAVILSVIILNVVMLSVVRNSINMFTKKVKFDLMERSILFFTNWPKSCLF